MLINHNIDINNIDNNENFIFQVLLNKGFTDTIGPQLWAMNRSMNKIIIDGITAKGPPVKTTIKANKYFKNTWYGFFKNDPRLYLYDIQSINLGSTGSCVYVW